MPPKKRNNRTPLKPPAVLSSENSPNRLDEEAENNFELELCWCIQKLEYNIGNGKLNDRQLAISHKNYNSLKSHKVPLIKKRQIMRNMFGDYREKMHEEEKKLDKLVSVIKFSSSKLKDNQFVFIKKAQCNASEDLSTDNSNKNTNCCLNNSAGVSTNIKTSHTKLSSLFIKKDTADSFAFNFNHPD